MQLYYVEEDYIEYLRNTDKTVMENKNGKRPYVGVVLTIDGIPYYAPLSSPKKKHRTMKNGLDFIKIRNGIYGAINFNNMIPVCHSALIKIDIENIEDDKYRNLLRNQLRYINRDVSRIKKTASNLHSLILTKDEELTSYKISVKKRCCKLSQLESAYEAWLESQNKDSETDEVSEDDDNSNNSPASDESSTISEQSINPQK